MTLGPSRTFLAVVTVAALWSVAASIPSSAASPDATQIAIKDFMFALMPHPWHECRGSRKPHPHIRPLLSA